jgi:hypothetical protein
MEEQIKKLKKLADEYADFVGRTPLERHVVMRYGNDGYDEISLYFMKRNGYSERQYCIKFEKIEVAEYKNTVEFPLNYTAKKLERIYNDVKKFLDKKKEEIKEQAKKEKEEEIKELRMKLAQMENEK